MNGAGNPHAILAAIADKRKLEPSGEPSLQNGLEMARSSMKWVTQPSRIREILSYCNDGASQPLTIDILVRGSHPLLFPYNYRPWKHPQDALKIVIWSNPGVHHRPRRRTQDLSPDHRKDPGKVWRGAQRSALPGTLVRNCSSAGDDDAGDDRIEISHGGCSKADQGCRRRIRGVESSPRRSDDDGVPYSVALGWAGSGWTVRLSWVDQTRRLLVSPVRCQSV